MGLAPHPNPNKVEHSPKSRPFHQTLAATVSGIIAGFVANGLIIAPGLDRSNSLTATIWCLGLALVLGASALARLKTHFAVTPAVHYSHLQFIIDLILIACSGMVFGLIGSPAFGTTRFWFFVLGMGASLLLRNIVLNVAEKYCRWKGSLILWIGFALVAGLLFNWWGYTALIGLFILGGSAVQIGLESRGTSTV